jgi:hypothetical protein
MVKLIQEERKQKKPKLLQRIKNEWDLTKRKWWNKSLGV